MAIVVAILALGCLLNARSLADGARARAPGWDRDVAVAMADGVLEVSRTLRLDRPAAWIEDLRTDDDVAPTPSGPPPAFHPSPERPVTLWATGDSLMYTVGPALVNASDATDVVDARHDIVYSSGLTRPDFFDWPAHLADELSDRPSGIVVFMVGANDGQPILTPTGWASPGEPAWRDEYRRRVAAAMDVLASAATTAYWVGLPVPRSEALAESFAVVNGIVADETSTRPTIRYVDAWRLLADADGGYTAYLPDESGGVDRVREDDGVHLSPAGADRLARAILDAVRLDWEIPA